MTYQERLLKAIPGGAHTYSRGYDQFPANAPQILERGKGVYTYDPEGNAYLDFGMALRSVGIGYSEEVIDRAVFEEVRKGNTLTRPSTTELEAAERLIGMIDSVDMVKFTKNGSTATTAAIKLARAYTGREKVVRCQEHPFFSYDDWFIGSTPLTRGIPDETIHNTLTFHYNDIASLQAVIDRNPGEIACVILEPAATEHPKDNFLHKVKRLCHENGIVFVLDEMITGFRWDLKGAQHYYGVDADLCTYGKAMANGFSVAAIAGKREIMELGSIEKKGAERLFLLSTTHGAEMSGLGAFIATVDFLEKEKVTDHYWQFGNKLTELFNRCARGEGVGEFVRMEGIACSPYYLTFDEQGEASLAFRTLFVQEMLKHGVMMPWIALAYRHDDTALKKVENALGETFRVYKKALEDGWQNYLHGDVVKPVFRKYN